LADFRNIDETPSFHTCSLKTQPGIFCNPMAAEEIFSLDNKE
jgi:hypothetical protein